MNNQINQHEAKTSQDNSFYNSIRERIMNSDLDKVFNEINKNNFVVNKEQYELLGNIAYVFGSDFVTQQKSLKKVTIENFSLRMKDLGISKNQALKFNEILLKVSVENIETTKDELKEMILNECKFDNEQTVFVKSNVNTIFRQSNFPIAYVLDIEELMKAKKLNYAQILKINKIIYEDINMSGASFKNLRALFNNKPFLDELSKGSEYFEAQKFTIVYFDAILSLKEWFEIKESEKQDTFWADCIETPELVGNIVEYIETETESVIENIDNVVEENKVVQATPDDTDFFILGVFQETSDISDITSPEELISIFDKIIEDEDLVQYVYKFFKEKALVNRKSFSEVYCFSLEEFSSVFLAHSTDVKNQYKTLVENYLKPIHENYIKRVIGLVNDIIKNLVIDNAEKKSYLFQQLNENQIQTYKHLHQTIGLIEDCNIAGDNIKVYSELRNFLTENLETKEIFDSIVEIDNIQLKINFYSGVEEFYSEKTYTTFTERQKDYETSMIEEQKAQEAEESKTLNSID